MLRKEQNDLLTQTSPGTPMGNLYRSYWIPALLAEELPENECPGPVCVRRSFCSFLSMSGAPRRFQWLAAPRDRDLGSAGSRLPPEG